MVKNKLLRISCSSLGQGYQGPIYVLAQLTHPPTHPPTFLFGEELHQEALQEEVVSRDTVARLVPTQDKLVL